MKANKLFNTLIASATLAGILTAGFPKAALSATELIKVCKEDAANNTDAIVYVNHDGNEITVKGEQRGNGKIKKNQVKNRLNNLSGISSSEADSIKDSLPSTKIVDMELCVVSNSVASNAANIVVSIEDAEVQTSQLPSTSDYFVVDFDNQPTGTAGFSKTNNGTTYTYSSDLEVKTANQWGGAEGSQFITQAVKQSIRSYNVKVDREQKYFGFWWSAGDPYNQITFKKDGNEVAVFKTKDLVDFIKGSAVTNTDDYYGNPAYSGGGGHQNEPFSFVNVFFNGQGYDEIVVATLTESGSAFESDNHTFSAVKQAVIGQVIEGVTPDADYDGLVDSVDPDPNNPDVDGDGLLDGNDKYRNDSDHDNDGLIDGQDPDFENPDFDGDGLLDGEDPSPEDANGDADNDGLTDAAEMNPPEGTPETDPMTSDSDGDGLLDGEEVNPPAGKFASDPTSSVDRDEDGLDDKQEADQGTNPAEADTDNDGLNDNDPKDPDSKDPDPTDPDVDGDGINDGDEENGDYDGDGEPDYELLPGGTPNNVDGDPLDNNEDPDSDNDGVPDEEEIKRGTNPYKQDYFAD